MAKAIKANPNAKYKIAGFADKATGSASFNQTLSEKRAQLFTMHWLQKRKRKPA